MDSLDFTVRSLVRARFVTVFDGGTARVVSSVLIGGGLSGTGGGLGLKHFARGLER